MERCDLSIKIKCVPFKLYHYKNTIHTRKYIASPRHLQNKKKMKEERKIKKQPTHNET